MFQTPVKRNILWAYIFLFPTDKFYGVLNEAKIVSFQIPKPFKLIIPSIHTYNTISRKSHYLEIIGGKIILITFIGFSSSFSRDYLSINPV